MPICFITNTYETSSVFKSWGQLGSGVGPAAPANTTVFMDLQGQAEGK